MYIALNLGTHYFSLNSDDLKLEFQASSAASAWSCPEKAITADTKGIGQQLFHLIEFFECLIIISSLSHPLACIICTLAD